MEMPPEGSALARQGSIYSLTFDEFQSALCSAGKDFGSMNMDELLRNIWTAEESQAIAASSATAAAPATTAAAVAGDAHQQQQPIQRQGSLTLPRTLSQKTVDEVWRDIMGCGAEDTPAAAPAAPAQVQAQRQPTLGEMTLEEFLVRAGVVREDMGQPIVLPPQAQALFPGSNVIAPAMQLGNGMVPGVVGVGQGAAAAMTVAAPATPVVLNGLGKVEGGDLSSLSPVPYSLDTALRVRKGPTVEKVVERRQRRMIKNRESAARSRARKQAYIMELEAEVAKLKEQKAELQKKQVEMIQKQKNEIPSVSKQAQMGAKQEADIIEPLIFLAVMERITQQLGPKAKRFCLRRTLTGPW